MRRKAAVIIIIMLLSSVAIAESYTLLSFYTKDDWYAVQSAEEASVPAELTEREAEIYRAGYANGHYDALHPAFIEGLYVLNTKTKKFHLSNCPTTLLIDTENREHSTLSPEELMALKYKPCGQCHPETSGADQTNDSE